MLGKLIYRCTSWVAATVVISLIAVVVSLWWNSQLSGIINIINGGGVVVFKRIAVAAVTILLSAGLTYTVGLCSGWTCETMAHELRMGYAKHFTRLQITQIENLNSGEQLSKLQNEIVDITNFVRNNLFSIINDSIRFLGTFSFMLWLNPSLTLLTNAPTALIMVYTAYSSKLISEAALQSQQANEKMNRFADTLISIFPIIRLFNAASIIRSRYNLSLDEWEAAGIREERRSALLMSLSALLSCIPLMMLFLIGGLQAINGVTTIGTLYIFLNLSGHISGVMMNIPGRIAMLRRFSANMKRLEASIII